MGLAVHSSRVLTKKLLTAESRICRKFHTGGHLYNDKSFILHERVEEAVVRCIRENQANKEAVLFLSRPGTDTIVESFKNSGVQNIVKTFKKRHECHFHEMPVEIEDYKSPIWNSSRNLLHLSSKQEKKILDKVSTKYTDLSVTVAVLQVLQYQQNIFQYYLQPKNQKNYWKYRIINSYGMYSTAHMEWFCFMSPKWYFMMVYPSKFKKWFHIYYNVKLCMTLNYSDFKVLGDISETRFHIKTKVTTEDKVHLVQLTPNHSILKQLSQVNTKAFYIFLLQLLRNKRALLHAADAMMPGCGFALIKLGYTMSDEVFDLTNEQYLEIFLTLISLPEFEGSHLQGFTFDAAATVSFNEN